MKLGLSLGKDTLSEYELEGLNRNRPLDVSIQSLVYSYDYEGYSGSGLAVYLDSNGKYHVDDIGHCSCNGPFDGGFNALSYNRNQLKKILEKRSTEYCGEHAKRILNAMEAQL